MEAIIETSLERKDVVTFELEDQTYALPIEPIVQIVEMVTITPIPQLDEVIAGVINFHGEAIAVVKLRQHLGLPDTPLHINTPILLTQIKDHVIGIIVDQVKDVFNVPTNRIALLDDILPEELGNAPIFHGLTYAEDNTILIIDPDQLFQPEQLEIMSKATHLLKERMAESTQGEPATKAKKAKPSSQKKRETSKRTKKGQDTKSKAKPSSSRRKKQAHTEKVRGKT